MFFVLSRCPKPLDRALSKAAKPGLAWPGGMALLPDALTKRTLTVVLCDILLFVRYYTVALQRASGAPHPGTTTLLQAETNQ
jgi:hypothetical protein